MKTIELCPQGMSLSGDETGLLEHASTCEICQAQVRLLKPACTYPALGFLVSITLGEPVSLPELIAHLDRCLACRLERLGFESLDEHMVVPRAAWLSRMTRSAIACLE
ncbi:MAG: hypothetical protein ETSY1_22450 [Candidatus Entotheonella factor]|uniref:Uncharacterized protein n=1 Tax=Entotheonella factor TaxID=1429438 RepID=W4LHN6_ENTF1|nr:MAG: hypothetical protein ETSY1_22450 [Candidatus Entotheonella factor]